jgi:hypothetical protein
VGDVGERVRVRTDPAGLAPVECTEPVEVGRLKGSVAKMIPLKNPVGNAVSPP